MRVALIGWLAVAVGAGCSCHPKITAQRLTPDCGHGCKEPDGIPFYLPKPLLIVSKNFRYVEEGRPGLTDGPPIPTGFDNQANYGSLNATANINLGGGGGGGGGGEGEKKEETGEPPAAVASTQRVYSGGTSGPPVTFPKDQVPSDGLKPDTFFTYHIVFVPDLTQKYGLKIKGGAGEIRAAMNLVNGWQFTGLGPYYMKDSSSAQNALAKGIAINLASQPAADVIKSLVNLRAGGKDVNTEAAAKFLAEYEAAKQRNRVETFNLVSGTLVNYAEIHVLEPFLTPDGQMEWREIYCGQFNREYLAALSGLTPQVAPAPTVVMPGVKTEAGVVGSGLMTPEAAVIQGVFTPAPGASIDPQLLSTILSGRPRGIPGRTAEAGASVPTGGMVQQVNVDCEPECKPSHLWRLGGLFQKRLPPRQPRIQEYVIDGPLPTVPTNPAQQPGPGSSVSGPMIVRDTSDGQKFDTGKK